MERAFKGVWIPAEIWLNKELSIQEKVILTEIDSLDNEDGCFASNKHFMDFMRLKERRIKELIKGLIHKGFITSKIVYKQNSKEIEKRVLKIKRPPYPKKVIYESSEEKCTRVVQKNALGVVQKNSKGGAENCLDNNTINNTNNNNIYILQKNTLQENFEKIWKEYPNKKGKAKSFEFYKQWIKGRKISGITKKLTNEQIENAVRKYKEECKKNRTEEQYIKHGDTFFNKAILDYTEQEEEKKQIETEYKEVKMTEEEYKQKMSKRRKKICIMKN